MTYRDKNGLSLLQAFFITLLLSALAISVIHVFNERFIITYPRFKTQCIEGWNLGLIDKYDRTIRIGEPYAFAAHNVPGREDGAMLGKYFMAGPDDEVEVNDKQEVLINGKIYAKGLPHAMKLNLPYEAFVRKAKLGEGRYWGLGDTYLSYDSRYWGSIDEKQIIGHLIRIF